MNSEVLDIVLDRVDKIYRPGDMVTGRIIMICSDPISHNGLKLSFDGIVTLQLSTRSVGLFESLVSSIKPIELVNSVININTAANRIPAGRTEFPFEVKLQATKSKYLFETYHGVDICVQYLLSAELHRSLLTANIKKQIEFIVEVPRQSSDIPASVPVPFEITSSSLQNTRKKTSFAEIPEFRIVGQLDSSIYRVSQPFTGELTIKSCSSVIRSIELRLLRVETIAYDEGEIREPTEIQNIQIAEGDVSREIAIPLYMVFPQLFSCASCRIPEFRIEFEVNLIVLFNDGHLVTETFPITLVR